MNILEYWAKLVAAGLISENLKNVYARNHFLLKTWIIYSPENLDPNSDLGVICRIQMNYNELSNFERMQDKDIQLRKDGKDLYPLEWRKPTEDDIDKMCWFRQKEIILDSLFSIEEKKYYDRLYGSYYELYEYCLVADHGQLSPTQEDFEKVYELEQYK